MSKHFRSRERPLARPEHVKAKRAVLFVELGGARIEIGAIAVKR